MHKYVFLIYFSFFLHFGASQKLVEKTVVNPRTKYVQVDSGKCFQLVLNTHQSNLLKVEAAIEGEYAKDLVIKIEEDGDNIGISADFLPSFKNPNDKLSAHKVISIQLNVTLPEYMTVSVHGTNTNVIANGKYTSLAVVLSDGNCTLKNVSEKISIRTQTGEIVVSGARGEVTTHSHYGKVTKGFIPKGNAVYQLQTIEGLITVNKANG